MHHRKLAISSVDLLGKVHGGSSNVGVGLSTSTPGTKPQSRMARVHISPRATALHQANLCEIRAGRGLTDGRIQGKNQPAFAECVFDSRRTIGTDLSACAWMDRWIHPHGASCHTPGEPQRPRWSGSPRESGEILHPPPEQPALDTSARDDQGPTRSSTSARWSRWAAPLTRAFTSSLMSSSRSGRTWRHSGDLQRRRRSSTRTGAEQFRYGSPPAGPGLLASLRNEPRHQPVG